MKSEKTKQFIIEQTILLIKETGGNVERITIRKIAEKADIGVGLINHYFESKDKLIEICVQNIIGNIVHSFRISEGIKMNPIELTKYVVKQVVDFLMENEQISKISIITDLKNPKEKDNSIDTTLGFAYCMSGGENPDKYMRKAFYLTAILQESFLRKDVLVKNISIDFYNKEQRNNYIDEMIDIIMGGQ